MNRDDFEDLLNDAEVKDFLHRAETEMFPKMQMSRAAMVRNGKPDAKLALEVGAAILFEKPLIVITKTGQHVPRTLQRIADSIVEIDDLTSPEAQTKLRDAVMKSLHAERKPGVEKPIDPDHKPEPFNP